MGTPRVIVATLAAVAAVGLAGCGGGSNGSAAPTSTAAPSSSSTTAPGASTTPTTVNRTDLAQAKAELNGTASMLTGADGAIGAADPNAAKAQEGTAP